MQWFQCVSLLLDDFVEIEMDVLHPVQAVAMNRQHIAETYGGKLGLLVGIDVQSLPSFWSAKEIAAGVHEILDCLARPEGGLMLAAGNAITPEVTPDRIESFWSSAWRGVRARPLRGSRSARRASSAHHDVNTTTEVRNDNQRV